MPMRERVGVTVSHSYNGGGSYQPVEADLILKAGAGSSDGADPKFLAAVMGNVLDAGATLSDDANYVAGVIGHYSITATHSTTYPHGGVLAGIADGVSDTAVHGVISYIDGDGSTTIAGAAFKVMSNNSTAASGFHFGLDLQDAAHDSYQPVDNAFYLSAPIRIVEDICIIATAGAPTNGVTADNIAGKGSLCVDYTNGKLYINTGTKADSTWTVVGTQT
jgi:hypothetical protein